MSKDKAPKDTPLTVKIEGDELVIRLGIDTLAFCAAHQSDIIDDWHEVEPPYVKINDVREFATDVVRGLLHEEEDGSTVISRCIDDAAKIAVEDGSMAIDYDFEPTRISDDEDEEDDDEHP